MQLDYHYYLIHHLAALAGFPRDDAETIAYASQYVDDATEGYPVRPRGDQYFDPIRTAHYGLSYYDWDVQKKVYIPFHFLPAQVRTDDPSRFSYVTACATGAASEPATQLAVAALSEPDAHLRLIRLGVTLHAIADTFSHFGFSGREDGENDVDDVSVHTRKNWQLKDILRKYGCELDILIPTIGHVQAIDLPDLPYMKWTYRDPNGAAHLRNNLDFCMQGAEFIYGLLKIACHPPGDAATLSSLLASLRGTTDLKSEKPAAFGDIKRLLRSQADEETRCGEWMQLTKAREYDTFKWREEALDGDVKWDRQSAPQIKDHLVSLKGKAGFEESDWACFHRAARTQRALVTAWLN